MKISTFQGTEAFEMKLVDRVLNLNTDILAVIICKLSWSPFIFKVDHEIGKSRRHRSLFEATDLLVFDIDEGMTLQQAIERCKDDHVIIATTKSHQVEKTSGKSIKPACDRFRVIKILERPVSDEKEYEATWLLEAQKLGCVDEQCKDTARFYFPCREVIFCNTGRKTPVAPPTVIPPNAKPKARSANNTRRAAKQTVEVEQGRLFASTLHFIQHGADTNWHTQILKAAMDLKEQEYSYDDAYELLTRAAKNYDGELDAHDIQVLDDVYERRGGKYILHPYARDSRSGATPSAPFTPPSDDELREMYVAEAGLRRRAANDSLTFIDPAFDPHFRLSYGITLIGGKTGKGKSTVCHNVIAQILMSENCEKRILLLSNEETLTETYSKIACLMLGLDWKRDYRDSQDTGMQSLIDGTVAELVSKVTIVTSKSGEYDTSDLDDVIRVLEYAKSEKNKYAVVIIDYLQTVSTCKSRPALRTREISKELGNYLKKYAQISETPVIVFAQLWPDGENHSDFSSRIQNDRNFANHAHTCLEIILNHEVMTTDLVCHKQRWGNQQFWKVTLVFRGGRLLVPETLG